MTATSTTESMRAVRHHVHGPAAVLQLDDVPIPMPGPGEVRIRVEACALNHLDVLQRRGPALIPGFTMPHTAGMDVAGVVDALGPDLADGAVTAGARVVVNPAIPCGTCPICASGFDGRCPATGVVGATLPGGYAEFVTVPVGNVHRVPDGVDLVEAATVPTIWMTAYHALHVTGNVEAGETALIHAGSSGVSTAAIQLARAAGVRVITTVSSPQKVAYAEALGADVVVDTSTDDIVATVKDVTDGRGADVVVDHVGPATFPAGLYSLAPRGRLVFLGNTTGDQVQFDLSYAYHFGLQLLGSDPYDMAEFAPMLELYWASEFVTPIDREYPLADAPAAHEHLESRRAMGKVVLRP